MTIRLLSLGMEFSAFCVWMTLIHLSKWGIKDPADRVPFRAAAVALLLTAVTSFAGTIAAIQFNQAVLITTWTPVVAMAIINGVGCLLGVVFWAKKIVATPNLPVWHPEWNRQPALHRG